MDLYETLVNACSQDVGLLKAAEAKLVVWEKEPYYYSSLVQILTNQSLDTGVRFMSCICIKNGISRYWRKTSPNAILSEERETMKSVLIGSFNEPVQQIATQIAVIVAKIARWDCPKDWPQLIPTLVEAMQLEDPKQQYQAMLVFHHVIKALASRRIGYEKIVFQELTAGIYSFVLNLWDGFTRLYFESIRNGTNVDQSLYFLQKSVLSLRSLRKLTIFGFSKPDKSEECVMFVKVLFQRLKECLECRLQVRSHETLKELTEKAIIKKMKILNELQDHHPGSSIQFLPMMLDFSFNYAFNDGISLILEGSTIAFVPFAVHCINLMKAIISNTELGGNRPMNASLSDDIRKAMMMKEEFFTQQRISYICEKIILNYFMLTQAELEAWDDNPEFYADDETGDSWLYSLRPCAESFFLAMFNRFRQEMIPEVVKHTVMAQQMQLTEGSSLKEILIKDAIYNAVGLSAFNLFDEIDFNQWFTSQLMSELHIKGSNFRIIRRRAIWLIGQWTGVKFSQSLRPLVYRECLELMKPDDDMTVRLAASTCLMSTINDFDFVSEDFLQFLEPSFSLLFSLLQEAKECETKMNVLNIMSLIVDKMSENINSHIENLIQYLPLLWEESVNHNMLRCAIISTLLQIVRAVCDVPPQLAPFMYPVISISTNINEPSHVYLMEEGLDLWLAVLENSSSISPELLILCDNILPIIEMTSENLSTVICIMQAYILLDPQVYLEKYGAKVVNCCTYLMTDMRPEGIVLILKLYEAILRSIPEVGLQLVKPALHTVFESIYKDQDYPMVMSLYLAIAARALLINHSVFSEVLQGLKVERAFEQILDVWIARMTLVTNKEKKKLLGLALTSLLTMPNEVVYERFSMLMCRICETLNDIMKEDDETGTLADSLLFADGGVDMEDSGMWDVEYKTQHYKRCQQLALKDPVYSTALADYVHTQLVTMKNQFGHERYQALMLTLTPESLDNLRDYFDIGIQPPLASS